MRVLMFGWEYPPHNSGGLGVACQGLVRALTNKGVEVTFVLPRRLDVSEARIKFLFADAGVDIVEVDSLLVPYVTSESYAKLISGADNAGNYGATLFQEVERFRILARGIAKRAGHDVIHAHDWLTFGAGIEAKNYSGKPFIAHIHATEVDRTANKPNTHIYDHEREGFEKADKIISVSGFTKKVLRDHYGVPEEKIEVVHNGIDESTVSRSSGDTSGIWELKKLGYKVVLYLGRITIMKGPDHFLNAANIVLNAYPKTIFIIAGSGDMEGQIMAQAAGLGISDKIIFAGFLRGEEHAEAFRAADLFVMPSVSEPFGLTSLEALMHGTPVLLSKQSGVSEVLKNVLKVDFWDVDDMADKMISVLTHNSLREELKNNGGREARMCTWDKAADKCISVYNNLAH